MSGTRSTAPRNSSRKEPMVEEETDPDFVKLKVKGQDGVTLHFKIKRTTKLKKVLLAYCEKRNIEYKYYQFLCNGERFPVTRTPDDLKMGETEEIDAMMHQDGGGFAAN